MSDHATMDVMPVRITSCGMTVTLQVPVEIDPAEPPVHGTDGHLADAWLDWHHARMERIRAAGGRVYPAGRSRWVRDEVPGSDGRHWHVRTVDEC